jgi:hypothetical protein
MNNLPPGVTIQDIDDLEEPKEKATCVRCGASLKQGIICRQCWSASRERQKAWDREDRQRAKEWEDEEESE